MTPEICYSLNNQEISHNQFDDEIIVIQLQTGDYFSLRGGPAAVVWSRLQQGPATAKILTQLFHPSAEDVIGQIAEFLDDLLRHRLLRQEAASHLPAENPAPLADFGPLRVEAFHDLQKLLLADPIHDVGQGGWPSVPPEARAA